MKNTNIEKTDNKLYRVVLTLWHFNDGDDYRPVTDCDIYELEFGPCGLLDSASWYKYRGYVILVDRDRKCFSVEAGPGTITVNCESLQDALTLIDENLLTKEA